jgi:hypothetical protein
MKRKPQQKDLNFCNEAFTLLHQVTRDGEKITAEKLAADKAKAEAIHLETQLQPALF